MNKIKFVLFVAGISLAITFTFSCSSDSNDDGGSSSSGGGGKSSSVKGGGGSSSSVAGGGNSSSVTGGNGGASSSSGGGYKTVKIGNQTWMAENLNINASGSKCYENKPANCEKYGRLYDWETAKSVCPSGWHLPSNEEWEAVGGANGFAAMPGGYGDSDGDFYDAEDYGYWWTATEVDEDYAWHWNIDYEEASSDYNDKTNLYSVRCVQNVQSGSSSSANKGGSSSSSGGSISSSSSIKAVSSSSGSNGNKFQYGSVADKSGKTYKTIKIGTQTWMAENLNYDVEGSRCYNDEPDNCVTYGRLYDWATAMALPSKCNSTLSTSDADCAIKTPNHQGICPAGWHIPSNDISSCDEEDNCTTSYGDWNVLMKFVNPNCSGNDHCEGAGAKLKATSGWSDYDGKSGNGTDDYGFSALAGGLLRTVLYGDGTGYTRKSFDYVGERGFWWSSEERYYQGSYNAYGWSMSYSTGYAYYEGNFDKGSSSFSVRCVKD